jgi:Amt family ammonium transporter
MFSLSYKLRRQGLVRVVIAILLAPWLAGPVIIAHADEPQPDPAGIATGDKATTFDAGGNSYVVTEPTDKTAPDYAKNKKAFDEFQAQTTKEPLAMKLADNVGHLRIATNFTWTLLTGYLVLFMQAGFALLYLRIGA